MENESTNINQENVREAPENASEKPSEDTSAKSQADAQKPAESDSGRIPSGGSMDDSKSDSKGSEKTYTEKEVQKRIEKALTDARKASDDKAETALREITALKNQNVCYKLGVRDECIDDAITLASKLTDDKTDFGKALGMVLEKYPQFKAEETPVTTGTHTRDNTGGGSDAALRKAFGLS